MTTITVNTDGSCLGNNAQKDSPGGFAAIIEWTPNGLITVSGGDPETTNNRMELSAVIEALKVIATVKELDGHDIIVRSDSQYITNAFNDHWLNRWQRNGWRTSKKTPVENQDLWKELLRETENRNIQWDWVRGHSGDPMNEKCDQLAVEQAELAKHALFYWVSPSNPKSQTSQLNSSATPAGTQPEAHDQEHGPSSKAPTNNDDIQEALRLGGEALRALEAISTLLNECPTYEQFRDRTKSLFGKVQS